jgi:hypothetical protein
MYYTYYINYIHNVAVLYQSLNCKSRLAATVDALGDNFKPELRAGWLAYILKTFLDGAVAAALWEKPLWSLMIESLMLLVCMLTDPLQIGKFSAMDSNMHQNCIFDF